MELFLLFTFERRFRTLWKNHPVKNTQKQCAANDITNRVRQEIFDKKTSPG